MLIDITDRGENYKDGLVLFDKQSPEHQMDSFILSMFSNQGPFDESDFEGDEAEMQGDEIKIGVRRLLDHGYLERKDEG